MNNTSFNKHKNLFSNHVKIKKKNESQWLKQINFFPNPLRQW